MAKGKSARKKGSAPASASSSKKRKGSNSKAVVNACEMENQEISVEEREGSVAIDEGSSGDVVESPTSSGRKNSRKLKKEDLACRFIGDPVPIEEAKQRWPHRYVEKVISWLQWLMLI